LACSWSKSTRAAIMLARSMFVTACHTPMSSVTRPMSPMIAPSTIVGTPALVS